MTTPADLVDEYVNVQKVAFGLSDWFWWVARRLGTSGIEFPDPARMTTRVPEAWPRRVDDPNLATMPILSDWTLGQWDDGHRNWSLTGGGHARPTTLGPIKSSNAGFADGHVETRSRAQLQWQVEGAFHGVRVLNPGGTVCRRPARGFESMRYGIRLRMNRGPSVTAGGSAMTVSSPVTWASPSDCQCQVRGFPIETQYQGIRSQTEPGGPVLRFEREPCLRIGSNERGCLDLENSGSAGSASTSIQSFRACWETNVAVMGPRPASGALCPTRTRSPTVSPR